MMQVSHRSNWKPYDMDAIRTAACYHCRSTLEVTAREFIEVRSDHSSGSGVWCEVCGGHVWKSQFKTVEQRKADTEEIIHGCFSMFVLFCVLSAAASAIAGSRGGVIFSIAPLIALIFAPVILSLIVHFFKPITVGIACCSVAAGFVLFATWRWTVLYPCLFG